MIIKLIAASPQGSGVDRYARDLARYMAEGDRRRLGPDAPGLDYGLTLSTYMTGPSKAPALERGRVLYSGVVVAGAAVDWDTGLAAIADRLAKRSRKVKKPVRHIVASLRDRERLDEAACADAVALLAAELGCQRGACAWAAHGDTDNFHLHVMAVTVDPVIGVALPFGEQPDGRAGWKEAMQRAIARIEDRHDLQPEAGARWRIVDGEVMRVAAPAPGTALEPELDATSRTRRRAPLRQEVLAWEARTGLASLTRFAQDVAGPVLDDATSWHALHRGLAPHGLAVRPGDRGGQVVAGDEHVKLSSIDRRHSWGRLVARLGGYEPAVGIDVAPYEPRVLDAKLTRAWLERQERESALSQRIDARVAALVAAREAALARIDDDIAAHRADLAGFEGDLTLGRDIASAWPRLRAAAAAQVREGFAARIAAVRALRYAGAAADDLGDVDMASIGLPDIAVVAPWHGGRDRAPAITPLAGYDGERHGDVVRYWRQGDHARVGRPPLVDAGAIIWVDERSDAAVEAALRLAQARYGGGAVFGSADAIQRFERVADRIGMTIETISIAEAERRASRYRQSPVDARRRAVARHATGADDAARLRAWARRYVRAGADIDHTDEPFEAGRPRHHSMMLRPRRMDDAIRDTKPLPPTRRLAPPQLDLGR